MLKKLFIFTALTALSLSASAKKETDMTWFCLSDDDPRGVYVNYPLRGAAKVQVGVADNRQIASSEVGKELGEDGRGTVRFDFSDNSESFIIITGGREERVTDNMFRAGYYDFSNVEDGKNALAIQYFCLSAVPK